MTAPALASIGRPALSSPAIASNDWPRPRARPKSIVLQARLMAAFRHCTFSEDSPERDFAAIEFLGRKVWMKIDYYDAAMEFGSEDPADASVTTRVMTILLPEDY
jgi:hypothetical protein